MPYTVPNQRSVRVHREPVRSNFLGIKNENWQAAARDLGAHGLQLYLYLAANANDYTLALSPTAIRQSIGMARSTYHDQFHRLVDKGYLVPSHGNTFEFYETPQSEKRTSPEAGLNSEECPSHDEQGVSGGQAVLPHNIEINNTDFTDDMGINNRTDSCAVVIQKPPIKEIVIRRPVAEGKQRPNPIEQEEYVF